MTRDKWFLVILISISTGCSGEGNSLFFKKKKVYQSSLINLNTILSEDENEVSFPTWFNDSIIKAHRIRKITRKSFLRNNDLKSEERNVSGKTPREIREYYFDENGNLIQLNVHNYYDDREIGSVLFSYSGIKDYYGFSKVKKNTFVSKTTIPFSENGQSLDPESRELDFKMHEKRKDYNKCLVYQDMETGDYLFFIPRKKYWGAMSVDSILAPNPKDMVVWGTPKHPIKKYQVSNKVNEKNVRIYEYQAGNSKICKTNIRKDYPFIYKRDFIYSKQGYCNEFIDSTFSEDIYVTRVISEIQYNKKNEPIRIIHRKENASNETEFFSLETFEYEKQK